MSEIIAFFLWVLLGFLALPVSMFLIEVIAGLFFYKPMTCLPAKNLDEVKAIIVIPAHNEASVIAKTIAALRKELTAHDQILVVADNCADTTADIVCESGVEVLERYDPHNRGKGFALDYAVRHVAGLAGQPDVIVIMDADCWFESGALVALKRICFFNQRPAQSVYLMLAPEGAGLAKRVAEFAFLVKNFIRMRGLSALRLPVLLTGSGMAFPWSQIKAADLASGEIVEDMKLGIVLAMQGRGALLCSQARVFSVFPSADAATHSQRTRWEHGHLSIITRYVPELFWQGGRRGSAALIGLALDFLIPPLALLVILTTCVSIAAAFAGFMSGDYLPFYVGLTLLLIIVSAVITCWIKFGRNILSLRDLLLIPVYILRKLSLYVAFLVKPQKEWIRTSRDNKDE